MILAEHGRFRHRIIISAGFQQQNFDASLGEYVSRHTASRTGTDNNYFVFKALE